MVLEHKLELEALLPAFGSTNGSYLLAKDEGNRPTHIRDPALSIFDHRGLQAHGENYFHRTPRAPGGQKLKDELFKYFTNFFNRFTYIFP